VATTTAPKRRLALDAAAFQCAERPPVRPGGLCSNEPNLGKGSGMADLVTVVRHPGYAVVTINRPTKLNALNSEVLTSLDAEFAAIIADESIRAVIVTGAGDRAF